MADFQYKEIDPYTIGRKQVDFLRSSVITASLSTSYSQCIEFVRAWFYDKFEPGFFEYEYIDGTNVLNEVLKPKDVIIVHRKPNTASIVITPTIDEEFSNENRDLEMEGTNLFIRRTMNTTPFFRDYKHNRCITLETRLLSMAFNFKIKVNTRAQQLDLFEYMRKAFRIGFTESYYVDEDFVLPRRLMLCIAEDAGFNIKSDTVVDNFRFIRYLNKHSMVPILYKHRSTTNNKAYYARFPESYVHFSMNNLSKDDGERNGHINSEFGIEMNIEVKWPAPAWFAYHTNNKDFNLPRFVPADSIKDPEFMFTVDTFEWTSIPDTNEKGWLLYVKDERGYYEENTEEPLKIEFEEYFEGELLNLIKAHMSRYISPCLFMDVAIFNNGKRLPGHMVWENLTWTSFEPPKDGYSSIVLYMDMEYVNNQRIFDFDLYGLNNRIGNEKLR